MSASRTSSLTSSQTSRRAAPGQQPSSPKPGSAANVRGGRAADPAGRPRALGAPAGASTTLVGGASTVTSPVGATSTSVVGSVSGGSDALRRRARRMARPPPRTTSSETAARTTTRVRMFIAGKSSGCREEGQSRPACTSTRAPRRRRCSARSNRADIARDFSGVSRTPSGGASPGSTWSATSASLSVKLARAGHRPAPVGEGDEADDEQGQDAEDHVHDEQLDHGEQTFPGGGTRKRQTVTESHRSGGLGLAHPLADHRGDAVAAHRHAVERVPRLPWSASGG